MILASWQRLKAQTRRRLARWLAGDLRVALKIERCDPLSAVALPVGVAADWVPRDERAYQAWSAIFQAQSVDRIVHGRPKATFADFIRTDFADRPLFLTSPSGALLTVLADGRLHAVQVEDDALIMAYARQKARRRAAQDHFGLHTDAATEPSEVG